MQFRRRPFDVEARQWIGGAEFATPIINWILAEGGTARWSEERREAITPYRPDDLNETITPEVITIDVTGRGYVREYAHAGDWIILDKTGFYVLVAEIFDAQFEPVDGD